MAFFPTSVPTSIQLLDARNNKSVTLSAAINDSVTSIPVIDTSSLPASGYVTAEDGSNEVIQYTSKTASTLDGCTRGADNTIASSHGSGGTIGMWGNAAYHNILKDEIISIAQNISDRMGLSSVQILAPTGSVSLPSYSFTGDGNTGFFNPAGDTIQIVTAGVARWTIDGNGTMYAGTTQGIQLPAGSAAIPGLNFNTDTDTGIYLRSTNQLGFSTAGTNWMYLNATGTHVYLPTGGTDAIDVNGSSAGTVNIRLAPSGASSNAARIRGTLNGSNTDLSFLTGGLERVTILNTGRVGINTTPIKVLDVRGESSGLVLITPTDDVSPTLDIFQITNAALSNVFSISKSGTINLPDGSASAPSFTFLGDLNTGIYRGSSDRIDISTGGASVARFNGGSSQFEVNYSSAAAVLLQASYSGNVLGMFVDNQSNTANSASRVAMRVAGSSAGDAYVTFSVLGVTSWSCGLDNSDSDRFKISNSSDLGTNDYFILDTTTANVAMGPNATMGPAFSYQNNDGSSDIRWLIYKNNSVGDPYTNWSTNATNWSLGIDNSDSDAFVLTEASSLGGVNNRWRMPTGGQMQMSDGSAAAPQYSFINGTAMGMYRGGSNILSFALAGALRLELNGTAMTWKNAGSHAYVYIDRANNTSEGLVIFSTAATNSAAVGLDNDGTEKLCFFTNNDLGTPKVTIDTGGTTTFVESIRQKDGSAAGPSYQFTNDINTGMYRAGTDTIGFATNGAAAIEITTASIRPGSDNVFSCGELTRRWTVVYAVSGTINTSHSSTKENIVDIDPLSVEIPRGVLFDRDGRRHMGYLNDSLPDVARPIVDGVVQSRDNYENAVIGVLCAHVRKLEEEIAALKAA